MGARKHGRAQLEPGNPTEAHVTGPRRHHSTTPAAAAPRKQGYTTAERSADRAADVVRAAVCAALAQPEVWPVLRLLWERTVTLDELAKGQPGLTPGGLARLIEAGLVCPPPFVYLTARGRLVWAGLRGLE